MAFQIRPSEEQVAWCRKFLAKKNLGQRGEFDGAKDRQFYGLLAEVVVGDLYGCPRPNGNGFDGGYDIIMDGKRYDVKCRTSHGPYLLEYGHNLKASQLAYDCDGYIFVGLCRPALLFTICGRITKEALTTRAQWFAEGTKRPHKDGTYMIVKGRGGMYEIKNEHLEPLQGPISYLDL